MLEDLPGKGATFPNPEEGRSSPSQTKEAEVRNAAVPAAVAWEPTRLPLRVFLGRQGTHTAAFGGCREPLGTACAEHIQCEVCSEGWEHPWGGTRKGWAMDTEEMQEIVTEVENRHEENQVTAR